MIILSQTLGEISGSNQDIVIDAIVDTPSDLPAQNDLSPYVIVCPSTIRCVSGERYMMDSGGIWIQQPEGVTLDLSGYYTSAEVDAAIAAALASYTNTSDMNTAINTAIMSTQYINRGTEPANGTDILDLPPGRYFKSSDAQTLVNIPSTFSGAACSFVIRDTTTTTGSRRRIEFYSAAPVGGNAEPRFWFTYKTGSGSGTWRNWVELTGTIL